MTIHVSDTYFIVAHIHYVLFGGSLFTIFAGVYYWFPKMTGRMYDERLGKLHFWTTFIFFNRRSRPMHVIGIQGMPRRVADYAQQLAGWNLVDLDRELLPRPQRADLRLQHDRLVARRPARRVQPVARAHARVAGHLAAADLQLRRDPDRRRRPVRVRRPGRGARRASKGGAEVPSRPARPPRRTATARPPRGDGAPMPHILVVANQTIGGAKLLDLVA